MMWDLPFKETNAYFLKLALSAAESKETLELLQNYCKKEYNLPLTQQKTFHNIGKVKWVKEIPIVDSNFTAKRKAINI